MKRKRCFVTDSDRCRLGALLSSCEGRAWARASCLSELDARLEDAKAVALEQTPRYLVTMNSTVELMDIHSGKRRRVTLAYPEDCELVCHSVSVFDRLGIQLLGSEIGDVVHDGTRRFCVTQILYQPETAGDHHL
jgi:regulator of nucleoside diphosphate kinase